MIQLPQEPQPGDSLDASWGSRVVRYLRAITPRPSASILPSVGSGGTTFAARAQRRLRDPRHPFQILDASDSDGPKVTVHLDSWLMKSRRANDVVTITGLDSAFSVSVGDFIWIQIGVVAGDVTGSASIHHGSSPWGTYPDPYDTVGSSQGAAFRLIGYVQIYPGDGSEIAGLPSHFPDRLRILYTLDDEEAVMQIVQCLSTNLIVSQECEETDTVVGLADWSSVPGPSL